MSNYELIAFIAYFVLVIGVGVYFFFKSKGEAGEKDYFLGGRNMNGMVAALSAGASDMSAWVLMGLPGSIFAYGLGQTWISIGLAIGTVCAWVFIAPRLRRLSIKFGDSITIPQYLTNRFMTTNHVLQLACAIIFMIAYCIYAASSIKACGTLFNTVMGIKESYAMIGASVIIVVYTFLGGFNAVCWTDFFQGLLMLAALLIAPIIALFAMNAAGFVTPEDVLPSNYYSFLSSGAFDKASIITIISGLGWGLGYMGMPHILVRYISIKSEKEMKKSRIIGSTWTIIIVAMASVVGIVARRYFGADPTLMADSSQAFISMVRAIFPALIAGILLSAILAASMSTADSQLLASSSAFASDVYKPMFRKNASDKEMLWAGRIVVIIISVVAFIIANSPSCSSIMDLVSNAWGAFGSAFGPVILLSLYWKRLNYQGALAGIVAGFAVDMVWFKFFASSTGLYEIVPGFFAGLLVTVLVSLITKAPSEKVVKTFEEGKLRTEE
jgi:sodium/proline symporter